MNREVYQSTPGVQHMSTGGSSTGWLNLIDMRQLHSQQASPLLPSPSSSVPALPDQYPHPPLVPWQDGQDLPESCIQLLLGGLVEEEGRCGFASFNCKKVENNWKDQVLHHQGNASMVDVKQERYEGGGYVYGGGNEDTVKSVIPKPSSLGQALPVSSPSPRSCITSFSGNMLDFSNSKSEGTHPRPDDYSECNSTATASAFKKPRIQGSPSSQSTCKVRKEKLGDRITVLHQLVSPFGKTDTASVLLEAIGYIRFLQDQIEALSSPYLANTSGSTRNSVHASSQGQGCIFPEYAGQLLNDACMKKREACDKKDVDGGGQKKDLRSRGLCLVPISCTMHVGAQNGADCWAPAPGAALR